MVSAKQGDLGAPPGAAELAGALGPAGTAWDALVAEVGRRFGPVSCEWRRFSAKYPWTYAVEAGGRKLAYLVPGEGSFEATVVLGEKAVAAALAAGVSDGVRAAIAGAKRYAEGRPVPLEVRGPADVQAVVGLVGCKLAATEAARRVGPARGVGRV